MHNLLAHTFLLHPVEMARQNCHILAQTVYDVLFQFVVGTANSLLSHPEQTVNTSERKIIYIMLN